MAAELNGKTCSTKTLIFDLGNVVAFFDHRRACRQLAQLAKEPVTEDSVYQAVFASSLELDFDCGRITASVFVERLRAVLGLAGQEETVSAAWADIFCANDDVQSLLPHLKRSGSRLVLASNTNELHFEQIERQFGAALAVFDEFVLSCRLGFRKPEVIFFERCLEAARAAPEDCIFLDDRPDFVAVARLLGMSGIVYKTGMRLLPALSDAGWSGR